MMLPSALLDLLSHRLSVTSPSILYITATGRIRHIQSLAAHNPGPTLDGHEIPMLKASRTGTERNVARDDHLKWEHQAQTQVQALTELEARVAALKDPMIVPKMDDQISSENSQLPEAELQDIYKDLLSFSELDTGSSREPSNMDIKNDEVADFIRIIEKRLPTFETTIDANAAQTGLSSKLLTRMHLNYSQDVLTAGGGLSRRWNLLENGSSLRKTISRLQLIFDRLEATWRIDTSEPSSSAVHIPYGMLSNTEWRALSQACLNANDGLAAEDVLDLMKRSGLMPSDDQYDMVLNFYANRGLVVEADMFFSHLALEITRDRQRDLLVKARVKAKLLDDACALIHSFETQATPAPMQSYTRVIQALFFQRGPGSEQHKAQAWDLFSHMRYVAHGTPDEFLYTVMIRACAESADPEPERALDLFTEMTVDNNILPTTYAYNAIILTCARSKKFALEAFRLAREMLNSHRDADGNIPVRLRPDRTTFCSLLEAAKRIGDLPRARWILAQMTRETQIVQEREQPIHIDERVMTHVFHAYASYQPPFRRDAVSYIRGQDHSSDPHDLHDNSENRVEATDISYRPSVPQSRQEIIKEATALWKRILEDRQEITMVDRENDSSTRHLVFGHVSLTSALLNAYMAVHYIHSPPSAAYEVYKSLFESSGIPRDAFTYVLALEAYAQGRRASKEETQVALSVARGIWNDWRQLEDLGVSQLSAHQSSKGVDARVVERAWTAMMRLLTINGHLHEAMDFLHQFVARYPPPFVKQPSPPDPKRSTRTSLYAERPIVRLTERSTVPEDRIPPFLMFRDLNLLHHRAIAAKRPDYIAYITWVSKAYEGALRQRRVGTLRPLVAR